MANPMPAKRRKLNQAQSASILAKPFVSPLKATRPDGAPLRPRPALQHTPSALATSVDNINDVSSNPDRHSIEGAATSRPPLSAPPNARRLHAPSLLSHSLSTQQKPSNPDEVAVQRQCAALERQIRTTRAEIDTLGRATTIVEKDSNAGLVGLGEKWRKAAQEAADDLFDSAKERVDDMGGVKAWKRSQKQAAIERDVAFGASFDLRERVDDDEDDEERVGHVSEAFSQDASEKRGQADAEDEGETSFTMDMMLGSMNIELGLIGFDKQKGGWV